MIYVTRHIGALCGCFFCSRERTGHSGARQWKIFVQVTTTRWSLGALYAGECLDWALTLLFVRGEWEKAEAIYRKKKQPRWMKERNISLTVRTAQFDTILNEPPVIIIQMRVNTCLPESVTRVIPHLETRITDTSFIQNNIKSGSPGMCSNIHPGSAYAHTVYNRIHCQYSIKSSFTLPEFTA